MTCNGKTGEDKKKSTGRKGKRNKTTDSEGRKYDGRKGLWHGIVDAFREEGRLLNTWLTPERCRAELEILNGPGKRGPKYLYPPSLILYMLLLFAYRNDMAYLRGTCDAAAGLEAMGFPVPDYTTVFKSEAKFFGSDLGETVMNRASEALEAAGVEESLDPVLLLHSGVFPEFKAPQTIVTCQKELERQRALDSEAEGMGRMMEVMVIKSAVGGVRARVCALDGSGMGLSGPGIYIEFIWNVTGRRFVKVHALVDVETQELTAFSVTAEKPGDAAMLAPMLRGARIAGVKVAKLLADSAYDTAEAWKLTAGEGVEFDPNLKERFGPNRDLPARNELLAEQERVGRRKLHKETGYDARWLVEVFFSIIKRMYGEKIRSRKFDRISLKIRTLFSEYSIHRSFMVEAMAKPAVRGGGWGTSSDGGNRIIQHSPNAMPLHWPGAQACKCPGRGGVLWHWTRNR